MGPEESATFIQKEWEAIVSAPFLFIGALIAIVGIMWLIQRWYFSGTLSSKNATIQAMSSQIELAEKQRDQALSDLRKLEAANASTDAGRRALAQVASEWPHPLQKTFRRLTGGGKIVVKVVPETPDEQRASANATYLLSVGFADLVGSDGQTLTLVSSSSAASVANYLEPVESDEDEH